MKLKQFAVWMIAIAPLFVTPLACAGTDEGSDDDGTHLLSMCKKALDRFDGKAPVQDGNTDLDNAGWTAYCLGFISGFVYGTTASALELAKIKYGDGDSGKNHFHEFQWICAPSSSPVTHLQEIRVVVKFLEDHPELLHADASVLVERAMAQAWPCKR
jgi:hypothetical protein